MIVTKKHPKKPGFKDVRKQGMGHFIIVDRGYKSAKIQGQCVKIKVWNALMITTFPQLSKVRVLSGGYEVTST